jgi:hypothetical protein
MDNVTATASTRLGYRVAQKTLTPPPNSSVIPEAVVFAGSVIQIAAEVGDLTFVNRLNPRVHALAERPEFPAQLEIL